MDLRSKSIDELIDLAINTMSLKEMFLLQDNPSMNVRRALVKNKNLPIEILKNLEYDPVANVSYLASKHPNSTKNRDFKNVRPCVSCEKDEKGLYCVGCPKIEDHKF